MQILLIEDDHSLANGLQKALSEEGYVVNHVLSGRDGLHSIKVQHPRIVILDLGLPDMDGLELLSLLRQQNIQTQILILTARDTIEDKVTGLDYGADDYLIKPFEMKELLARLRVLDRRAGASATNLIRVGDVCLDINDLDVRIDGNSIELSRREYMLLKALMQNAGKIMTRDSLESKLYSWGDEISSNAIEVHIHHLRKKLPEGFIKTVRGVGYKVQKV